MKALIVYGYYDNDANYGKVLECMEATFKKLNIAIQVTNPFTFTKQLMSQNSEKFSTDTAAWVRGLRCKPNEELIAEEQNNILSSDMILFYWPVWWETLPPLMGQWLNDVFRSKSFEIDKNGKPLPLWGDVKGAMILTTSGYSMDTKRENLDKVLQHYPMSLSPEMKDLMIGLGQSYPLTQALAVAGIPLLQSLNLCEVGTDKDFVHLEKIAKNIEEFVCKVAVNMELDKPKPLLIAKNSEVKSASMQSIASVPEVNSKKIKFV